MRTTESVVRDIQEVLLLCTAMNLALLELHTEIRETLEDPEVLLPFVQGGLQQADAILAMVEGIRKLEGNPQNTNDDYHADDSADKIVPFVPRKAN
jgi:hypothetical protein